MKRIILFVMLGFVVFSIGLGFIALNLQKAKADAVPAPVLTIAATPKVSVTPTVVETSTAPTDEPTTASPTPTPTPSKTETLNEGSDLDMSNYTAHRLPADPNSWTPEEWQWWNEAATAFEWDFGDIYETNFGKAPSNKVLSAASDFAEATCSNFDEGYTLDEVAAGIVDSGGSQKDQAALALAVKPGVSNFCPWNAYILE